MAAVTVFVDDAVQGRLPNVCAYDGAPAERRVPVTGKVGGMNPAWLLLVLLGPIGWLVLLLMLGSGSESLHALVPVCRETVDRWRGYRRDRWVALAAFVGSLVLLFLGDRGRLLFSFAGASFVALLVTHWRATMGGIGVHLDASRRWVTLTGVHGDFVAATRAQQELERR